MDWAIVKNEGDRLLGPARAWSIESIEAAQQYDEVAAALGRAGVDDQPAGGASASASSPNSNVISPASACCFNRRRRSPERSTASASCRPFSVCRGRRQTNPPFSAPR
jgi:hypothetical protein